MSRTERQPFDNVVPMFRHQPTVPAPAERTDLEGEALRLMWRLLDLADTADPSELGYLAWRTRQTANDIAYKARHLLEVDECRSAADYSVEDRFDVWVVDITYPEQLGEAA
jgi:hypothetical protein